MPNMLRTETWYPTGNCGGGLKLIMTKRFPAAEGFF